MISAVVSSADALCTLISLQCDTVCQLLKRSLGLEVGLEQGSLNGSHSTGIKGLVIWRVFFCVEYLHCLVVGNITTSLEGASKKSFGSKNGRCTLNGTMY